MTGPAVNSRRLAVNFERLWQTRADHLYMIQSAQRIENYHYAIRHLAGAAEALTRAGREVIYLNIGDPQVYGFRPPEHIVEPVIRALKNSLSKTHLVPGWRTGWMRFTHADKMPDLVQAVYRLAGG